MSSKIIAGTTAGTALNMSADTTGILEIQTGSTPTTAITVDASQNVGIGTTSPSYKLDVQRAASNGIAARFIRSDLSGGAYVYVDTAGSYYGSDASANNSYQANNSSNYVAAWTNGTERMRIDSSGNVGIGGTSPSPSAGWPTLSVVAGASKAATVYLQGNGATGASGGFQLQGGSDSLAYLWNFQNTAMVFATNNTERMRILAAGDIAFGQTSYTTPPTSGTDLVAGGLVINPSRRTTGSAANCNWDGTTGVFYRSTSSLRYKTDVQNATYGLSDVLKLRPITYKGKSEADGDKVFGGFIAEEIDALGLKEFVEYDAEGNPDSLAYANMVSLLTKAIQEQQTMIEELKTKVTALEAE